MSGKIKYPQIDLDNFQKLIYLNKLYKTFFKSLKHLVDVIYVFESWKKFQLC